jgi:hypothetical protein
MSGIIGEAGSKSGVIGGIIKDSGKPAFFAKSGNYPGDLRVGADGWTTGGGTGTFGYAERMPLITNKSTGNCFDTGNNLSALTPVGGTSYVKFTAPVSGKYLFGINIPGSMNAGSDWASFGITVNSTTSNVEDAGGYILWHSISNLADSSGTNTIIISLEENDYVTFATQSVQDVTIQAGGGWFGYLIS